MNQAFLQNTEGYHSVDIYEEFNHPDLTNVEIKNIDDTPLEDVGALMVAAGHPAHLLVGIGATRYTELGESTYLKPGDRAIVRVYDTASDDASVLRQTVRAAQ